MFKPSDLFDLKQTEHAAIFEGCAYAWEALKKIKGYLAAGSDYEARVQTLKAQLPSRYHDVVTLTVSQPEDPSPPDRLRANPKNGG